MKSLPKPKTERNEARLEFVRQMPCLIAEYAARGVTDHEQICTTQWEPGRLVNRAPCEAHHVYDGVSGGVGIKPDDRRTIPLCVSAHYEFHRIGKESFEKRYG